MPDIISEPLRMTEVCRELRLRGNKIGFVPTMGALHEGHLSLMRHCAASNDVTIVSIFVNPTQFAPGEDYERYPRTMESDAELCDAAGVDFIFAPEPEDMYPRSMVCWVDVGGDIASTMCAMSRPGHFRGVATVVSKLFNIVQPDNAYFGQKDYQQCLVVRRLVEDLNFPVDIHILPTVRESDGMAMSSRNAYLDPATRRRALSIHRSLAMARLLVMKGERDPNVLLKLIGEEIEKAGGEIDYVQVVSPESLEDYRVITGPVLLAVAAFFKGIRLIDNELIVEIT
ncbi:MAG: pantoate--beta-alanine ligase [Candidatus Brocadiia bacterium]